MKKKIDPKKWQDILAEVSKNITEVSYRTWFLPLTPLDIDEDADVFYAASSDDFQIKLLNARYIPIFEQSIETVYGKKYKVVVKFMTDDEIEDFIRGSKPEEHKQTLIETY